MAIDNVIAHNLDDGDSVNDLTDHINLDDCEYVGTFDCSHYDGRVAFLTALRSGVHVVDHTPSALRRNIFAVYRRRA